jgi:hypothetical protein
VSKLTKKNKFDNEIRNKKVNDWKDKRFSFFANTQGKKAESRHSFAHLAACLRTKQTHEGSQKSKSANPQYFV